jgi:hypothetical protein
MWGALLISSLYKIFAVEKTFLQHTQWICEGDPHSPPEGEASQGGKSPLTPLSDFFFLCPIKAILHGARVDETPSARGSIAIESRVVAWISIEQRFS